MDPTLFYEISASILLSMSSKSYLPFTIQIIIEILFLIKILLFMSQEIFLNGEFFHNLKYC